MNSPTSISEIKDGQLLSSGIYRSYNSRINNVTTLNESQLSPPSIRKTPDKLFMNSLSPFLNEHGVSLNLPNQRPIEAISPRTAKNSLGCQLNLSNVGQVPYPKQVLDSKILDASQGRPADVLMQRQTARARAGNGLVNSTELEILGQILSRHRYQRPTVTKISTLRRQMQR